MNSIGSSLSIEEDHSISSPLSNSGGIPARLALNSTDSDNCNEKNRSGREEDGASNVSPSPLMRPFAKREVKKVEQFIMPPNSNNPNPNNSIRTRSRRTESVDSYDSAYEGGGRRGLGRGGRGLGRGGSGMMYRGGRGGNNFIEFQRILTTFQPSTRTPLLCDKIVGYLDQSTLIKMEAWFMILSTSNKRNIFRSLKYRKVKDDHGLQFEMNSTTPTNYYVILRGNCTITLPRGKIFNLRAGDTFGGLQMPPNLMQYASDVKDRSSYKGRETTSENMYKQPIVGKNQRAWKNGKVSVTIPKGGEIAILNSRDVKEILEKISLKLSMSSLLTSLGLRCMEGKLKLQTFKAGSVLQTEGSPVERVYTILSGECTCVKKNVTVPETDFGHEASRKFGGSSYAESGATFDNRVGRKVELKKIVLPSGFTSNVSTSTLMLYGPKSIVGDVEVLLGGNADTTVVCKGDVMSVSFNADDFRERLGNYTDLKNQFIKLAKIRRSLMATQLARALGYVEMGEGVDWDKEVEKGGERIRRVWREEREREQRIMLRMIEEAEREEEEYSSEEDSDDDSDNGGDTTTSGGSVFGGGGLGVKAAKLNQRSVDYRSYGTGMSGFGEKEEEKKEAAKKEERSVWVDRMKNTAVFPSDDLDLGPPEVTFEMVFQRRVKKYPRVNRAKLMMEFKRLLLDELNDRGPTEYEEPKDRFERLDYIDSSGYKYTHTTLDFVPHKGDGDGEAYDFSLLTPFPTLTRARKLHGKPLPVVPHSPGFLNPVNAFGVVRQREKLKVENKKWQVAKGDKTVIKKALEEGFYPHFKESGMSIITRPSTVSGSVASSSVHGGSVYGRGGLLGSGLGGGGSSLLSSSYGSFVDGGGPKGLGPSVWESEEERMNKKFGGEAPKGYYDVVKRSRGRSMLTSDRGMRGKGRRLTTGGLR